MALLSHRQSRLVGGVLLATLFVALLVSYRPNPSSVGDGPAGWSSASASPMAGASKEAQTTPVLEDVLVPVMDHGRFVGPETRFLRGVAGYSLFQNIYTKDGVLIAVTSDPASLPPVSEIMSDASKSKQAGRNPVADESLWLVLSPSQAARVFERPAVCAHPASKLQGATIFFSDSSHGPGQSFLGHYFHLVAEMLAGAWRVLAAAPELMAKGSAIGMSFPRRMIIAHADDWRDHAGLNAWFLATVFPSVAIEESPAWADRSRSRNLYVFDQLLVLDRWASHRHGRDAKAWNKVHADVFREIDAPADWWAPIRQRLMLSLAIKEVVAKKKAVVVYISRQVARSRRLTPEAHDQLVASLSDMDSIELHVPQMELMSPREQMELVSKADILLGVHGNGLTNELWLKPGGAVIEIMDTGGFTKDYQVLTEPLNHSYYPIWHDKVYDWKAGRVGMHVLETFHGIAITVSAPFIRSLIETLLATNAVEPNRPAQ